MLLTPARKMLHFARGVRASLYALHTLNRPLRPDRPGKPHGLPGELIVSLTSYPPRFGTLELTLACLCDQTVRADRIILWVAEADTEQLPNEIRWNMRQAGVEIRTCEDIGPYKKLIPALREFPDAYIVTADDDLHYPADWLETLVRDFDGSITCLWGHAVEGDTINWRRLARNGEEVLPGSGAGVLYPPNSLHPMISDRRYAELCPTGDDLWYYWMAKLAGSDIRKVGKFKLINWLESQHVALWNTNNEQNDAMDANLRAAYAGAVVLK